MNWRIASAILAGGIIGGAIVFALAPMGLWYLLGIPVGGASAWLVYCWRDIVREAPRVWASVSTWRPNPVYWKWSARMAGSLGLLGIMYAFWAFIVLWALTSKSSSWFVFATWASLIEMAIFLLFTPLFLKHASRVTHRTPYLWARQMRVLRAAFWVSPIGVAVYLAVLLYKAFFVILHGLEKLPQASVLFGRFLLRLFVAVHSHDALDCFLYAAAGVLAGALATHSVFVIVVSAAFGLGLAFVGRFLARLVPPAWVAQ